jgi:ribosomal protein S26
MSAEEPLDGKSKSWLRSLFLTGHSSHTVILSSTSSAQNKPQLFDHGRGANDGDASRDGTADSSLKRKFAERDPESPGQDDTGFNSYAKKEKMYYGEMHQDSPASYPKHVLVPASERPYDDKQPIPLSAVDRHHHHRHVEELYATEKRHQGPPVLTPDSQGRNRPASESFGAPPIYPKRQQYAGVYRAPSYQEVEYNQPYRNHVPPSHTEGGSDYSRPRRWACDFCNVATFLSYEEACAHEEACARRHNDMHYSRQTHSQSSTGYEQHGPPPQHGSGMGALYHASQEVVTPPTPHGHHQPRWSSPGPPLPVLPHEQGYYRQGYYDQREDQAYYGGNHPDPYYYQQRHPMQTQYGYPPHHHQPPPPMPMARQRRMLLAMPSDVDSLSDRQCYVRSEMLEIFAASEKDVAARHSKGAQKLQSGQVGIRCVHCAHLRPRDRAERAVCYPSSISRIYQTVADMQRFHFEQCQQIPEHVRRIYAKLKTTRPRGVGSPQTYWVQSAKSMGLADTEGGIRFESEFAKEQAYLGASEKRLTSDVSIGTL